MRSKKPACWLSEEIGHLSVNCPGRKAPEKTVVHTRHYLSTSRVKNEKEALQSRLLPRPRFPFPTVENQLRLPFKFLYCLLQRCWSLQRSQRWCNWQGWKEDPISRTPVPESVSDRQNKIWDTSLFYARTTKGKCVRSNKKVWETLEEAAVRGQKIGSFYSLFPVYPVVSYVTDTPATSITTWSEELLLSLLSWNHCFRNQHQHQR